MENDVDVIEEKVTKHSTMRMLYLTKSGKKDDVKKLNRITIKFIKEVKQINFIMSRGKN